MIITSKIFFHFGWYTNQFEPNAKGTSLLLGYSFLIFCVDYFRSKKSFKLVASSVFLFLATLYNLSVGFSFLCFSALLIPFYTKFDLATVKRHAFIATIGFALPSLLIYVLFHDSTSVLSAQEFVYHYSIYTYPFHYSVSLF